MRIQRTFGALLLALSLCCAFALPAVAQQTLGFDVVLAGGTAPVSVTVHDNPKAGPLGATVLALHGFTETAAAWEPLTEALFQHPATKRRVARVIALDLPGHGNSPIPTTLGPGALFGNLTIYDNVAVLIQVIDQLRARGMGPRVVMGHSMGGLEIQAAQEALLASGSSLAKHGVHRAILLAPVPVVEVSWAPTASEIPPEYYRFDNGVYIVLDELGALYGGGFTTTAGLVTPAAYTLDLSGLIGAEPSVTAAQLVGVIPELPRPGARRGAFALTNGTHLTVVGFSEDVLTPAAVQPGLYEHLIGRRGLAYLEVVADDAVHSMFISNPDGLLEQVFDPGSWF